MMHVDNLKNIEQEARAEIAKKVGKILTLSDDQTEKKAALELAKILAEDVAISVREALSQELKHCQFLPKDILVMVAKDIEEVSMPFLIASEAVTDDFLEEIVRTCNEQQQESIAQRQGISEAVAFAIADVGSHSAITVLADNETADLSSRSYNRVVKRFPEDVSLMEKLVSRADLPADMVEKLIFKVSHQYGEMLCSRFGLSQDYATYLASLAKRQVFSKMLELAPQTEIYNYLKQLNKTRGLDSDLLLAYLQNNNLRLFTSAISVLLAKPYDTIDALISKRDKTVVARLLDAAGFSKSVIGVLLISYERLKV
ncbi:DUF2336 domain-containing protein [Kordiimonas aquimaris]|uniref:DUF2336 domain-containing protein n=1 Tax=Kordiimonas aquimaris TaxID=707591 RepID=UPI0021D3C611|nr:DUF2336 domain-containing protein [Kordiimonas aquimaris]